MVKVLWQALREKTVDVLVIEGTHLGEGKSEGMDEYDLEDEIVRQIRPVKGLVLASFSPQHVDRLVAFIRAAKKTKRLFVADLYCAYVLHLINLETIPYPSREEGFRCSIPSGLWRHSRDGG